MDSKTAISEKVKPNNIIDKKIKTTRRSIINKISTLKNNMTTNGKTTSTQSTKRLLTAAAILAGFAGVYTHFKNGNRANNAVGKSLAAWLPNGKPITIRKRITVKAKPSNVYAAWRNLENLPNILSHLKKVDMINDSKSYWEAKGPAGTSVSWYANITEDIPGSAISWQAEQNADVPNSGRITFNEKPSVNTLIEIRLTYQPPAGNLGKAIAQAFGENPEQQIEDDLYNFKLSVEKNKCTTQLQTIES